MAPYSEMLIAACTQQDCWSALFTWAHIQFGLAYFMLIACSKAKHI